MKNFTFLLLLAFCFIGQDLTAQAPQGFNFQAVARDLSDNIIKDEFVSIRIWILADNSAGAPVYREIHQSVYTGVHGVMTLTIGNGQADSGTFSTIDWGSKNYFVRVDLDTNNGTSFDQLGTSQLLSVPYALFAQKSGDGGSGGSDNWGTQVVQHDATLTGSGTTSDPLRVDKSNVDTDEQLLSINGNQLTITNGNTISIPTGGTDADSDPNNEIQDLSNTKTNEEVTISITDGNSTTFNVTDQDADPNNELQELSNTASGNEVTLNISDGNSTTFNVSDSDADSNNEIQDLSGTSSGNDITLNITGGSGVTFSVEDGDTHSSNELQDLSINGNQLSISNGNTVNLPSSSLWSQNDQFLGIHYLNEVSIGSQDVFGELNVNGRGVFFNQGTATVRTTIGNATLDFQGASGQKTLLMSGEDAGSIELREGGNPLMLMAESATGGGFSGIWNKFGSRVIVHQTNAQNGVGEIFTQAASIFNSYNGFLQDQPTHGFFSVLDDDSQSQAGLFVDAGGNGVVFADIKNFRMDYPGRDNQEIWYASLEGPEAAAYERGTATLVNGEAFVAYSDHYSLITNLEGTTMILTPLSAASFGLAVVKKESNGFYVKELNNGTGNYSFDWESKAIRKGYEKFEPVRDKSYAKSGMTSIQN